MQLSKRNLLILFTCILFCYFIFLYELPYYIYKPGKVDALNEMVEIEQGFGADGTISLVTVSSSRATPIQYIFAKIFDYHEIIPLEEARPQGISDEDYKKHQLNLMKNSQNSSIIVAFRQARKDVTIHSEDIVVANIIPNMPADGILEIGDEIVKVDNKPFATHEELVYYMRSKERDDNVEFTIMRNGTTMTKILKLSTFPDDEEKVGIGIQLVTTQSITTEPPVEIKSGDIGGPSAGLMFALELYNQLTEEDITRGYHVSGTGELDSEGNVKRIGGVEKKVVAADENDVDIFFVPDDDTDGESNYETAKKTAREIGTTMDIVPVKTFQDALRYLENLSPKLD